MLIAAGLAGLIAIPAAASAQRGKIIIQQTNAGVPVSVGKITIRLVGTAIEDGYLIFGKNHNWIIAADEMFFPETALLIRKHTQSEGISMTVDDLGTAEFTDLTAGVYLVTQTEVPEGYVPFSPFLMEIPINGEIWQAEAYPELESILTDNPQTGDHPAPIIAAMVLVLSAFALLILGDKGRK